MFASIVVRGHLAAGQDTLDGLDRNIAAAQASRERLNRDVAAKQSPAIISRVAEERGMVKAITRSYLVPIGSRTEPGGSGLSRVPAPEPDEELSEPLSGASTPSSPAADQVPVLGEARTGVVGDDAVESGAVQADVAGGDEAEAAAIAEGAPGNAQSEPSTSPAPDSPIAGASGSEGSEAAASGSDENFQPSQDSLPTGESESPLINSGGENSASAPEGTGSPADQAGVPAAATEADSPVTQTEAPAEQTGVDAGARTGDGNGSGPIGATDPGPDEVTGQGAEGVDVASTPQTVPTRIVSARPAAGNVEGQQLSPPVDPGGNDS